MRYVGLSSMGWACLIDASIKKRLRAYQGGGFDSAVPRQRVGVVDAPACVCGRDKVKVKVKIVSAEREGYVKRFRRCLEQNVGEF